MAKFLYVFSSASPTIINSSLESIIFISEGSDATFSCEATGVSLPTITFVSSSSRVSVLVEMHSTNTVLPRCYTPPFATYFQEKEGGGGGVVTTRTNSILSLINIEDSDSGNYTCVAYNGVPEMHQLLLS